jgi:hypothetical protein
MNSKLFTKCLYLRGFALIGAISAKSSIHSMLGGPAPSRNAFHHLSGFLMICLLAACGKQSQDRAAFFQELSSKTWEGACEPVSENTFYSLPIEYKSVRHEWHFDRGEMQADFTSTAFVDDDCTQPTLSLMTTLSTQYPRNNLPAGAIEVQLTPQSTKFMAHSDEALGRIGSVLRQENPLLVGDLPKEQFFDVPRSITPDWAVPPTARAYSTRLILQEKKLLMGIPPTGWNTTPGTYSSATDATQTYLQKRS